MQVMRMTAEQLLHKFWNAAMDFQFCNDESTYHLMGVYANAYGRKRDHIHGELQNMAAMLDEFIPLYERCKQETNNDNGV